MFSKIIADFIRKMQYRRMTKNKASAGIYYNPKFGYLITSYAHDKDTGIRYAINPVIVVPVQDEIYLGDKVIEALNITKKAKLTKSKQRYNFWEITGAKTWWPAFSKKFRFIFIDEVGGRLEIVEHKRIRGGAYSGSEDDVIVFLELHATPEQMRDTIMQILSRENAHT